jgi:hypothetical protein
MITPREEQTRKLKLVRLKEVRMKDARTEISLEIRVTTIHVALIEGGNTRAENFRGG